MLMTLHYLVLALEVLIECYQCVKSLVEYFIKFNSKKSMCIKYGEKYDCEKAQLNEETIIWVDSVKHLGNMINNDLNNSDDCKMKCYSFISTFNKLHFRYANVQSCILSKLFKYFCTSSLWNFSSEGFRKITTLWNIAVRKICILPNTTHRHLLGLLLNQPHIVGQLFRRNVVFYIVSDIAVAIL